jgi:hypothetical protein
MTVNLRNSPIELEPLRVKLSGTRARPGEAGCDLSATWTHSPGRDRPRTGGSDTGCRTVLFLLMPDYEITITRDWDERSAR